MKILVADDHVLFRQGLCMTLADLHENVEIVETGSFSETLERAGDSGPFDIVLLDLNMPGMSPFEGVRAVHERMRDVPIVILSASERPSDVSRAIECGALGYILKSSRPEVLSHALPLVLSGEMYLPPVVLSRDTPYRRADRQSPGSGDGGPFSRLTPRERDVLGQLIAGLSNKEIAQALTIDEGTVKIHIKAVLRKLEVNNRTQAATFAVRQGWLSTENGLV